MEKYKKLIIILALIMLLVPFLKVDYFNGEYMEIRNYSVIGLLIQDIKDGTMGTKL